MFSKAVQTTKKENKEREAMRDTKALDMESGEIPKPQDLQMQSGQSELNNSENSNNSGVQSDNSKQGFETNVYTDSTKHIQKRNMEIKQTTCLMMKSQMCNFFLLFASYIFVLLVALLRGGEGKGSVIGLDSCSEYSWA